MTIHTFNFLDLNNKRLDIKIGLDEYLSIRGGHGQQDFEAANEAQEKFKKFWNDYHLKSVELITDEVIKLLSEIIEEIKTKEKERLADGELLTDSQEHLEVVETTTSLYGEDCEKYLALLIHLGLTTKDIEENIELSSYGIEIQGQGYRVLTDDEATEAVREYLEDSIDEYLPREFTKSHLFQYFDVEKFVSDNEDERGSHLAGYDGVENEETVNGTTYYIYKN